jgi:hypothetical protein
MFGKLEKSRFEGLGSHSPPAKPERVLKLN